MRTALDNAPRRARSREGAIRHALGYVGRMLSNHTRSRTISDLISEGLADPEPDVRATFEILKQELKHAPADKRQAWEQNVRAFIEVVHSSRLEIVRSLTAKRRH